LLRAAVVGGGAYAMGKRSAQRSAGQDQQPEQQQASGPATPTPPSMLDQLNQLTALHQQGALTDAEFDAAKAKLLGS
jgi:membrane protease subunit (stomatin/prohibitin family)